MWGVPVHELGAQLDGVAASVGRGRPASAALRAVVDPSGRRGRDGLRAAAEALPRLEHRHVERRPALVRQPPRRAQARSAGADDEHVERLRRHGRVAAVTGACERGRRAVGAQVSRCQQRVARSRLGCVSLPGLEGDHGRSVFGPFVLPAYPPTRPQAAPQPFGIARIRRL